MKESMNIDFPSGVTTFKKKTRPSFRDERYDVFEVKETNGAIYYRVDDYEKFEPKKWISEKEEGPGRWFGFEEPKSRTEAIYIFNLNPDYNSAIYLHKFVFINLDPKKNNLIYIGIEKDHGHTIAKLHSDLIDHVQEVGKSIKLP